MFHLELLCMCAHSCMHTCSVPLSFLIFSLLYKRFIVSFKFLNGNMFNLKLRLHQFGRRTSCSNCERKHFRQLLQVIIFMFRFHCCSVAFWLKTSEIQPTLAQEAPLFITKDPKGFSFVKRGKHQRTPRRLRNVLLVFFIGCQTCQVRRVTDEQATIHSKECLQSHRLSCMLSHYTGNVENEAKHESWQIG